MRFKHVIDSLIEGKQIRRKSWPEDGSHVTVVDEKLMVWRAEDKGYHPLIVHISDLRGEDWGVCERTSLILPKQDLIVPKTQ